MYIIHIKTTNTFQDSRNGITYIQYIQCDIYNICTVIHAMIKRKDRIASDQEYIQIFKKKANNGYHRLKIHDLHDLSELSSHPIDISIYIYDILTGFILLHVYFQRSSKVP